LDDDVNFVAPNSYCCLDVYPDADVGPVTQEYSFKHSLLFFFSFWIHDSKETEKHP
jgi:hypothetical protein